MFTPEEIDAAVQSALETIDADKNNAIIVKAEYRNGEAGITASYVKRINDSFIVATDLSWTKADGVIVGAYVHAQW